MKKKKKKKIKKKIKKVNNNFFFVISDKLIPSQFNFFCNPYERYTPDILPLDLSSHLL
jgi:hypothetical protein